MAKRWVTSSTDRGYLDLESFFTDLDLFVEHFADGRPVNAAQSQLGGDVSVRLGK